jgi:hypothetical protein
LAASGYMTEADVESIWDTTWDTTRFGKINVRIGELLNFLVHGDATTDVTTAGVLPILEQISEEILLELANSAKVNKYQDIWQFISMNISKIDWEFYDTYMLKKVRQKLGNEKIELVRRTLPSSGTNW